LLECDLYIYVHNTIKIQVFYPYKTVLTAEFFGGYEIHKRNPLGVKLDVC